MNAPVKEPSGTATPEPPRKKSISKWVWSVIFLLIAGMSIWAITAQNQSFSFADFWNYITEASPLWLLTAFAGMLGFIVFEGLAIRCIIRTFDHKCGFADCCVYSAADIYFSAITPSASGGQPASAYFMVADGLPAPLSAVALLLNLVMYALAILVIGIIGFALHPEIFLHFGTLGKVLILIGCAVQIGLVLLFALLLQKSSILQKAGSSCIHFLARIRLIHHEEKKQKKLSSLVEEYRRASDYLSGRRRLFLRVFLFNFLQRLSQITVSVSVFLACGGSLSQAGKILSAQIYAVLGSNCVPIPGAVGISDYLMLDGFDDMMPLADAVNLELFSRSLSFYFCILVCGIAVLVKYWLLRRRKRRNSL